MNKTIQIEELTIGNIYKSIREYCGGIERCTKSIKSVFFSKLENEFWSRRTVYVDESVYVGLHGNVYLADFDKVDEEDGKSIFDVLEAFQTFEFHAEGDNLIYLSIGDNGKYKYHYAGTLKKEYTEHSELSKLMKNKDMLISSSEKKSKKTNLDTNKESIDILSLISGKRNEKAIFEDDKESMITKRLEKVCPPFIEVQKGAKQAN